MKPHSTGTIFGTILIRFAAVALFLYALLLGAACLLVGWAMMRIPLTMVLPFPGIWQLQGLIGVALGVFAILLFIFSVPLGKLLAKGLD